MSDTFVEAKTVGTREYKTSRIFGVVENLLQIGEQQGRVLNLVQDDVAGDGGEKPARVLLRLQSDVWIFERAVGVVTEHRPRQRRLPGLSRSDQGDGAVLVAVATKERRDVPFKHLNIMRA